MTTAAPETAGSPEERNPGNRRYCVSLSRLEELHRSAVHLIFGRLTLACPSYGNLSAESDPAALIREIREFHGDKDDFIRYDMPIQEIVFRTLLAKGNEPTSLSELHQELTTRCANGREPRPVSIDEAHLGRVLDSDTYYGFIQV